MSPRGKDNIFTNVGFPRVSGDEPFVPILIGSLITFSPRERG